MAKVKIYNKGRRSWPLEWKEGKKGSEEVKKVICNPNRSVEVPKAVADRMIKNYPNDFLEGEALASPSNDLKALKKENAKLKKENEALKAELEALQTEPESDETGNDPAASDDQK